MSAKAAESSNYLKIVNKKAPGLKSTKQRLSFRGEPNSIQRGSDVSIYKGGGKRMFVFDSEGRIVKEITPQRVKVRNPNTVNGKTFESFKKLDRLPTAEELKLLEIL